ncbi:hypothetical protein OTK01_000390 [Caldicellulosiruptor acetigenus]|uniref:transglutaminase domain-containing protein n=1 Tax=Caldicellulosiruptor acetigenus TaxID=301953 RepID=UPI0022A9A62C|nr:transglutaminase domain-containing protein [Caldicellulosiruptor acetigenus]WAM36615.1 hypothetical protein OTK01_000390 [Caldicellulosiruptor acetigenus]
MKCLARKLGILILFVFVLSTTIPVRALNNFNVQYGNDITDVGGLPYIRWVVEKGWMTLHNNTFRATDYIKKCDLAVILSRVTGRIKNLKNPNKPTFVDVTKISPYYKYIETMKDCLPFEQTSQGLRFYPNNYVTVEEAVYSAIKALEYHKDEWNVTPSQQLKLLKRLEEWNIVDAEEIEPKYLPYVFLYVRDELISLRGLGQEVIGNGKKEVKYAYFCVPKYKISKQELAELLYNLTAPVAKTEEELLEIYRQAFKEVRDFVVYKAPGMSIDQVERIDGLFTCFYSPIFSFVNSGTLGATISREYKYLSLTPEEIEIMLKKAQEIINQIIKPNMTDEEKIKAVHDYLIAHTSYDTDTAVGKSHNNKAYTAYGAIIDGLAVCEGYAGAFELLAQLAGVPAIYVFGLYEGIPHGWNAVYINGELRHVDVTFDDTSVDGKTPKYDYFLLTDKQMGEKERQWDKATYQKDVFKYAVFCEPPEVRDKK